MCRFLLGKKENIFLRGGVGGKQLSASKDTANPGGETGLSFFCRPSFRQGGAGGMIFGKKETGSCFVRNLEFLL